jgi:hypothetical protein
MRALELTLALFYGSYVAYCFMPMRVPPPRMSRSNPLCLKQNMDDLWSVIEETRYQRDRIKEEIMQVVELQRNCSETSVLYSALEWRFVQLLKMEDETVIKIAELVDAMITNSKMGKNATVLYKSYFKDV